MIPVYKLFIHGEFKETKETQKVINPSTGEIIAETGVAGEKEIEGAIAAARDAFDHGPWPRLPLSERKNFLLKIAQGILERAGEFAQLETHNTGKPIKESTFMDIPSAAKTFECLANNFEKYLEVDSPALEAHAECLLSREPQCVVVLIIPWNYPLLIASWKLASALAAGNTVILKPSSLTPLTALELAKVIHEAGLPKGVVNVINASGAKVGEALCADKRVDMISFTGSNEVGRQIMQYASKNAKKLLMELGGKSASIILADADLDVAVNSSLCSIFLNQGQMCTAMSRILVHSSLYDTFVSTFTEKAQRIRLGLGGDFEAQMGPLVSDAQRKKVMDYVQKAKQEGARILCGGKAPENPELQNGFFFEPTVIVDVSPAMKIFREEIFGPVAVIGKFSKSEEALGLANDSEYGLASCIWGKNQNVIKELTQKINAGTIWVNTYGMFYHEAPYGGFKQSGFGKELGREGFLEYTRLKNVIIDKTPDGKPLVNYWYGF